MNQEQEHKTLPTEPDAVADVPETDPADDGTEEVKEGNDDLFEQQEIVADPKQSLVRLDKFLMDRLGNCSRSKVQDAIRAGSVWVNCYQAMDPAVPFGGYKMSGYGRESGKQHLDEYLNVKAVWIKTA